MCITFRGAIFEYFSRLQVCVTGKCARRKRKSEMPLGEVRYRNAIGMEECDFHQMIRLLKELPYGFYTEGGGHRHGFFGGKVVAFRECQKSFQGILHADISYQDS